MRNVNWPTDRALVRAALDGDQRAASRLLERHGPTAWRAAYAVCGDVALADDALQEGAIRAIRHLAGFDSSRPFDRWFRAIVVKRALTLVERRTARREEPLDQAADIAVDGPSARELELPEALDELPVDQRRAIVLHELFGFSTAEIADLLDLPAGTVRSHLTRARRRLKGLMVEPGDAQ